MRHSHLAAVRKSQVWCAIPDPCPVKLVTGITDSQCMAWKWFVQTGDDVEGPFRTEEVQARLQAGTLNKQHLIWAAGLEHWQSLGSWQGEVHQLSQQGPGEGADAWHYAVSGQSKGPVTRDQLIAELKTFTGAGEIMLWTKGM